MRSLKTDDEAEARIAARQYEKAEGTANISPSFKVAAARYLRNYHTNARTTAPTQDLYVGRLVEELGHLSLDQIQPQHIYDVAETLYEDCANSTKNRSVIAPTRSIFKFNNRHIHLRSYVEAEVERTTASPNWTAQFCEAASPFYQALLHIMQCTAARLGQALALRWSDIDFDARTAKIPLNNKKGASQRTARLSISAIQALSKMNQDQEFIFTSTRDRSRPIRKPSIHYTWQQICQRAGIEYIPPHQAGRHTAATNFERARAKKGISMKAAIEAGGWKNHTHYLKTYVHTSQEEVFDLVDAASEAVQNGANQSK